MSFQRALDEHFPGSVTEHDFAWGTVRALGEHGFDGPNTIACVSVCRDELTRPLADEIQKAWGEAFNFSSLAGMLFLGKTGFLSAQHHAPRVGGRERYAFFGLSHVALGNEGEVGLCARPGRDEPSAACGALVAFRTELSEGHLRLELDPDDVEQSLLKQRLIGRIRYGEVPDLVTLTKLTHDAIREDLERTIGQTVDPAKSDCAVLTGVNVHGPDAGYVWPGALYAVVSGKRVELALG
jgi:hypothetical protein